MSSRTPPRNGPARSGATVQLCKSARMSARISHIHSAGLMPTEALSKLWMQLYPTCNSRVQCMGTSYMFNYHVTQTHTIIYCKNSIRQWYDICIDFLDKKRKFLLIVPAHCMSNHCLIPSKIHIASCYSTRSSPTTTNASPIAQTIYILT